MPDKSITKDELEVMLAPMLKRIEHLESRDKRHADGYSQLSQAQAKLDGKFEEGLKAVKDQVKDQGERYYKELNSVKDLVTLSQTSIQKLIETTARETNQAINLVVQTLGIDEHGESAFNLKTDLKYIREQRFANQKTFELIRTNVLGMILKAVGIVMFAGICMIIGQKI